MEIQNWSVQSESCSPIEVYIVISDRKWIFMDGLAKRVFPPPPLILMIPVRVVRGGGVMELMRNGQVSVY